MTRVRFYIGTNQKDSMPVTHEDWEKVESRLIDWAGGFTRFLGHGGWYDRAQGVTVMEPCRVYECMLSYTPMPQDSNNLAHELKSLCNQNAVLCTQEHVDGVMV
jgi:hypothetical protein